MLLPAARRAAQSFFGTGLPLARGFLTREANFISIPVILRRKWTMADQTIIFTKDAPARKPPAPLGLALPPPGSSVR